MPYDPNSPSANQLLSVSQPIIQGNFSIIDTSFQVNHVAFNGGTNNGKHKFVELPVALTNPIPPTLFPVAEIALYGATNAATAVNELYINKTNQATVVQVPMTASVLSISSAPAANTGAWTYLPSGLVLVMGVASFVVPGAFSGVATVAITVPIAISTILSFVACPYNSTTTGDLNFAVRVIDVGNPGATNARLYISSRTAPGPAAVGTQAGYQFTALCVPVF